MKTLTRTRSAILSALLTVPGCVTAQQDAQPKPDHARHYHVTDLGVPPGWTFSQANTIGDTGVISGLAAPTPTSSQRAVVWSHGKLLEFGTLGGMNSAAFGAVRRGGQIVAVGQAESADLDPYDENFCLYGTHEKCLPLLWNGSAATQLPTLGGNNGSSGPINANGQVAGTAETSSRDSDCPVRRPSHNTSVRSCVPVLECVTNSEKGLT